MVEMAGSLVARSDWGGQCPSSVYHSQSIAPYDPSMFDPSLPSALWLVRSSRPIRSSSMMIGIKMSHVSLRPNSLAQCERSRNTITKTTMSKGVSVLRIVDDQCIHHLLLP